MNKRLVSVLAMLILALIVGSAQAAEQGLLTYNLGTRPAGQVIDLPSWACGNISIEEFHTGANQLGLVVNVPEEFSNEPVYRLYSMRVRTLSPGELTKFQLKNGTSFSLYWKYQKDSPQGVERVVLVLRRHCSAEGCVQLCDCATPIARTKPLAKTGTLTIHVSPWARVRWEQFGVPGRGFKDDEATGTRPLVLYELPVGDYGLSFESDGFETIHRTTQVKPGENTYIEVDLAKEAPTKSKLLP